MKNYNNCTSYVIWCTCVHYRCTTVRYSTTVRSAISSKPRQREVAKRLLEVLVEMNLTENPVLFHIFSNGGCTLYSAMREELKENSRFEDIEKLGVVYDSAPGKVKMKTVVAATFNGYRPSVLTTILQMGLYALLSVYVGVETFFGMFGWQIRGSLYDDMIYYHDYCPELYLFSKADTDISACDVENVIERRRMQGVDITSQCWDDSLHVQHLRKHRESYINQCYDFLKKCIKIADGEEIE